MADWCRGGEGLYKDGARLVHAGAAGTDWCSSGAGLLKGVVGLVHGW